MKDLREDLSIMQLSALPELAKWTVLGLDNFIIIIIIIYGLWSAVAEESAAINQRVASLR